MPTVAVTAATEVDTANTVTAYLEASLEITLTNYTVLYPAEEFGTANAVEARTPTINVPVGAASETGLAQAVSAGYGATLEITLGSLGTATEVNTAQSLAGGVVAYRTASLEVTLLAGLAAATETDTAGVVTASGIATIGVASETDTAGAVASVMRVSVGVAEEFDYATLIIPRVVPELTAYKVNGILV